MLKIIGTQEPKVIDFITERIKNNSGQKLNGILDKGGLYIILPNTTKSIIDKFGEDSEQFTSLINEINDALESGDVVLSLDATIRHSRLQVFTLFSNRVGAAEVLRDIKEAEYSGEHFNALLPNHAVVIPYGTYQTISKSMRTLNHNERIIVNEYFRFNLKGTHIEKPVELVAFAMRRNGTTCITANLANIDYKQIPNLLNFLIL